MPDSASCIFARVQQLQQHGSFVHEPWPAQLPAHRCYSLAQWTHQTFALMSQDGNAIVKANKGKPPTAYGAFLKLADRLGPPPEPAPDAPQQLPPFKAGAPHTSGSEMEVPALEEIGYHQAPTTSFTVSMPALHPHRAGWAATAEDLVPQQAQLCAGSQGSSSATSGLALLVYWLMVHQMPQ